MNYRHAYHAGNIGDVLKHAVLTLALEELHRKPASIFLLDTHAGLGLYDLASFEAEKTGEWQSGIGALLNADAPEAAAYLAIVGALNPDGALRTYPGSPAIAAALARPGDRAILCELHPDDAAILRRWAKGRPGISVHERDGYEALGAFLPPPEARGLILVDPPYEAPDEYQRLADAVVAGHRKWPAGRWLIWHPVKDRAPVWRLEEALVEAGIANLLAVELLVRPADGVSLAGSGLILVNPPYGLERRLELLLPQLQAALAPAIGATTIRRISAEG